MAAILPVSDPSRVLSPVLPNRDRRFSTIPDAAHALPLSLDRQPFRHAVQALLTMTARGCLKAAVTRPRRKPAYWFFLRSASATAL